MSLPSFDQRVLKWFDVHGRKHLPWQQTPNSYSVWVSEIMLQQTQVATVIPYYERFIARFPTLASLAKAPVDDVLAHWSGLGYYARARNLHRCAKQCVAEHQGSLPTTLEALQNLPGIGRSTAAAILSLAHGQAEPILDGNVKRVLARHQTIDGWPGQSAVLKRLWALSEALTPNQRTGEFNQAMMDLGATLCTRSKPRCADCPVAADCGALANGTPTQYPGKKPKKDKPVQSTVMLLVRNADGATLLERRPPSGIWGGLWSLPEVAAARSVGEWLAQAGLKMTPKQRSADEPVMQFRHTFSHYHLDIDVRELRHVQADDSAVHETSDRVWWDNGDELPGGVAAPVAKILTVTAGD